MPGMKTLTGMTGTGSAVELAEMLRQLGRGRDTVLAHITPEEAQMLMDQGGSGTTNPATGLPEFQNYEGFYGEGSDPDFDIYAGPYTRPEITSLYPEGSIARGAEGPTVYDEFGPRRAESPASFDLRTGAPRQTEFDISTGQGMGFRNLETSLGYPQGAIEAATFRAGGRTPEEVIAQNFKPPEPGLAQKAESGLQQVRELTAKYPRLTQALGAGAQGIAALVQARRARQQGREQAARFAELGRPLREEAENLRQQALSGTLTPQQAAQQEAIRARMRQAAASRGVTTGTQAAMIENQLSRARAELSQTNLNNALRQLNLANAYDEAAIKVSLAADREADELLGEIFTNIARDLSGARATTPQTSRMTTGQLPTQEVTRRPEIPRG
jgi:hypothetical protein